MIIDDEIDQQAYSYLLPRRSRPAWLYILPKIHKSKQNPPGRPIVSANSHPTENISQFVDSHLNPLVPKLSSYIKDTTHFLKKLDDLKELPPGSLLVTLDVSSLYTNIPHNEGIEACRKALNSSDHLSRSHLKTASICDLIISNSTITITSNYMGLQWALVWPLLMQTYLWVTWRGNYLPSLHSNHSFGGGT